MTRRDHGHLDRLDRMRRASRREIISHVPPGTVVASTRVQPPRPTREDLRREAAEAFKAWSATRVSST